MDEPADNTGLSRDMLTILMGDGAGYLEAELDALSEPRRANLARICRHAIRRLGDAVSAPGGLHSRLAGCLLHDGSFVHDPLSAVYWGGVTACSRTAIPDDDRGLRRLKLLSRLTTLQVRTHYLFYGTLRRLLVGRDPACVDFDSKRYRMAVFVPAPAILRDMGFLPEETPRLGQLLYDVLNGLGAEVLMDGSNTGSEEYLKRFFKSDAIRGEGVVFAPSLAGVQFFLWAFGAGDAVNSHFLAPQLDCAVEGLPSFLEGAAMVYNQ